MKKRLAWSIVLTWTAACSDGYPTKSNGLNLHFQMTQQEAIDALNAIGSRDHLKHEWRYNVTQACVLEVSTHGRVLEKKRQVVSLLDTESSLVKSATSKNYSVSLSQTNTAMPTPTIVLSDGTWGDASQIRWLLDYLPKFCRSSVSQPEADSRQVSAR
jgi:hypothetical protein